MEHSKMMELAKRISEVGVMERFAAFQGIKKDADREEIMRAVQELDDAGLVSKAAARMEAARQAEAKASRDLAKIMDGIAPEGLHKALMAYFQAASDRAKVQGIDTIPGFSWSTKRAMDKVNGQDIEIALSFRAALGGIPKPGRKAGAKAEKV